jgi:putative ABC transport system permease protein
LSSGEYSTVPAIIDGHKVEYALSNVEGVEKWTRQVTCVAELSISGYEAKVFAFGVLPEEYFEVMHSLTLRDGAFFDPSNSSILLNASQKEAIEAGLDRPIELGEPITLAFVGSSGASVRTVSYRGSYSYPTANPALDRVVLVDPPTARYLAGYAEKGAVEGELFELDAPIGDIEIEEGTGLDFSALEEALSGNGSQAFEGDPADGPWSFYMIRNNSSYQSDDVSRAIANALMGMNVEVLGWREAAGMQTLMPFAVQAVFWAGLVFVLIGSCFVVSNTLAIAVLQRTKEIGTIRAIGASKSFVFLLITVENLVVAFLGMIMGLFAALWVNSFINGSRIVLGNGTLATVFGSEYLRANTDPLALTFISITVLGASILMSLYPASAATRIQPITAISEA